MMNVIVPLVKIKYEIVFDLSIIMMREMYPCAYRAYAGPRAAMHTIRDHYIVQV